MTTPDNQSNDLYILENKEEYDLNQLIGCGIEHVINSWLENYDDILEVLCRGNWLAANKLQPLDRKKVYRVLKRTAASQGVKP